MCSCGGPLADRVPPPMIVPEAEAEQPLEWDQAEWEQGWTTRVRLLLVVLRSFQPCHAGSAVLAAAPAWNSSRESGPDDF